MRVRRVTVSAGRPNEIAEHGYGYTGNGLSIFTRTVAHANGAAAFANAVPARLAKGHKLPLRELVKEYSARIRWLEAELRTATNAAKREKLNLQLEIKRRRLVELQAAAAEVES